MGLEAYGVASDNHDYGQVMATVEARRGQKTHSGRQKTISRGAYLITADKIQ